MAKEPPILQLSLNILINYENSIFDTFFFFLDLNMNLCDNLSVSEFTTVSKAEIKNK